MLQKATKTEENIQDPRRDFVASKRKVEAIKEKYDQIKADEPESYILELAGKRVHLYMLGHHLRYYIDEHHITITDELKEKLMCAGFVKHLVHENLLTNPASARPMYRNKEGNYVNCDYIAEHPEEFDIANDHRTILDLYMYGHRRTLKKLGVLKSRVWEAKTLNKSCSVHDVAKLLYDDTLDFSDNEEVVMQLLEAGYEKTLVETCYLGKTREVSRSCICMPACS